MGRKILLSCGILSSLLYTGMNVFVPMYFDGYSSVTQTVSELSAIDAPTRTLWVWLAMIYILLFAAFGLGIWRSAMGNRHLRIAGGLIFIYVVINFYWPPMHLRGNPPSLTDALHIAWAMVTIILMMLIMGFGAMAFGKAFRWYTVATFIVFLTFGALIGIEAPGIAANTPTPHIGVLERINIGAFMMWVIAFAVNLLSEKDGQSTLDETQSTK
jgi:hypothetical protein